MEALFFRSERLATAARRTSTSLSFKVEVSIESHGWVAPARLNATTACLRVSGFLSARAFSSAFVHCWDGVSGLGSSAAAAACVVWSF